LTPELSVVVLAYRSERHAGDVLLPLYELLEAAGISYELIAVANYWAPDDVTGVVARELARGRPAIRVVAEPKRGGMGWDMRSGLRAAAGRFLVVIDGDGQVPMESALEAYRQLKATGADIVKGRRYVRGDGSVRTILSLCFNALFRLLFRTRGIWDINGRPKGMTREAWQRLGLRTDDWFTDAEIILKARRCGLEIREFPVSFLEHPANDSSVGPGTVWEFVRNMARARLGRHPALHRPPAETSAGPEAVSDTLRVQARDVGRQSGEGTPAEEEAVEIGTPRGGEEVVSPGRAPQ
jgi:glycosyltransferase involved in cell wall biosynthesis